MSKSPSTIPGANARSTSPHRATRDVEKNKRPRNREKTHAELKAAFERIKNSGEKLGISAVAAEVGVSSGLIHNTYSGLAEDIRKAMGKSTRQQRDEKISELAEERARNKELRSELSALLRDFQRVASIAETLRQEVATLRAGSTGNVTNLLPRHP